MCAIFLSLLDWFFARDDMCPVVSGGRRERSLHAMLKFEGLAASLSLESAQFSTIYSGYAWARSKCDTSWCVECTLQEWWRTNLTNIFNTDSLRRVCFMHVRDFFLAIVPSCQSLTCLFLLSSYAKLGISMETLLDPGRGIVQKGLLGGVGLRRRRLF